jgi:hypothetical protein
MVEITEPGKFTDVIFQLLCAYHKDFCIWQGEDFHTSAARYFKKAASTGIILPTPGAGLVAIAQHQLQLFGE